MWKTLLLSVIVGFSASLLGTASAHADPEARPYECVCTGSGGLVPSGMTQACLEPNDSESRTLLRAQCDISCQEDGGYAHGVLKPCNANQTTCLSCGDPCVPPACAGV